MGEIMNSPKGVKSGVPERVSTYGTCHDLPQTNIINTSLTRKHYI